MPEIFLDNVELLSVEVEAIYNLVKFRPEYYFQKANIT